MGKNKKKCGDRLDGRILDRLYEVVESRADADPEESYTARLMERGPQQIAKKVGEEAVEALIEGLVGHKGRLAAESADLLYHLTVLWAVTGLTTEEVWEALADRQGKSGFELEAAKE